MLGSFTRLKRLSALEYFVKILSYTFSFIQTNALTHLRRLELKFALTLQVHLIGSRISAVLLLWLLKHF
jgi:hypothetical protein